MSPPPTVSQKRIKAAAQRLRVLRAHFHISMHDGSGGKQVDGAGSSSEGYEDEILGSGSSNSGSTEADDDGEQKMTER